MQDGVHSSTTRCKCTKLVEWLDSNAGKLPYCYYYLRVLYFANFCDLEKFAKLSTRKNFYQHIRGDQHIRYSVVHALQSQTLGWVATSVHALLFFLSFLPFLFFLPVARYWAQESDVNMIDHGHLRCTSELVLTDNGYRWGCTMWHVTSTVSLTKTTQVAATLV